MPKDSTASRQPSKQVYGENQQSSFLGTCFIDTQAEIPQGDCVCCSRCQQLTGRMRGQRSRLCCKPSQQSRDRGCSASRSPPGQCHHRVVALQPACSSPGMWQGGCHNSCRASSQGFSCLHLVHGADVLHQESTASGCAHTQHRAGGDRQAGRAVQTGCASLAAVLPAFSTHKPSLSQRNLGWWKKDSGGMRLQAGARTRSPLGPQRDPTAGRTMAPGQDADSQACRRSRGCWGSPPVGRHCGGPVVKGWPWIERKM